MDYLQQLRLKFIPKQVQRNLQPRITPWNLPGTLPEPVPDPPDTHSRRLNTCCLHRRKSPISSSLPVADMLESPTNLSLVGSCLLAGLVQGWLSGRGAGGRTWEREHKRLSGAHGSFPIPLVSCCALRGKQPHHGSWI